MSESRTNIHWYPGHMAKAQRQMQENLKSADMIIELRDSRIPDASANPLLDQLAQNKPRIIILTKRDKADDSQTKVWTNKLKERFTVLPLDITKDNLNAPITKACLEAMKEKHDKQRARGINPRAVRAMVVGIPNVGKSTLINRLAKRKAAKTADQPGVTRNITVITINKDLQLLDTPGVLWPKFEDEKTGFMLAITGAINDDILPIEEVAYYAIKLLMKHYPDALTNTYGIEIGDSNQYEILRKLGEKRVDIVDGKWDRRKTSLALINDIRDDKLGKITWEYENEE